MKLLLIVPAIPLAMFLYAYFIGHWRAGFQGLLFILPFTGLPIMLLPSPLGVLFKDFAAVIPTYIGFLLWLRYENRPLRGVPPCLAAAMVLFSCLVLIQLTNPALPAMMMGLIGMKVWLFYLPIYFAAFAYCRNERDIIKIARIVVALSFLPAALGLIEFALTLSIGYEHTMTMIYGSHAEAFTQRFSQFSTDSDISLYRIPSTFSFATQYIDFIIATIPVAFLLMKTDPARGWRRAARISLPLLFAAGLTSGSRQAFIFLPLELLVLIVLTNPGWEAVRQISSIVLISLIAVTLMWSKVRTFYTYESTLFGHYADTIAKKGLQQAIAEAPFGKGPGTNTGAARYALQEDVSFVAIENYYAKTVYELGIAGLIIMFVMFAAILTNGLGTWRFAATREGHAIAGALVGFVIIICLNSFKGWAMDLDPINVYFWLFTGILAKVRYIL
jgi:hypothetical protein